MQALNMHIKVILLGAEWNILVQIHIFSAKPSTSTLICYPCWQGRGRVSPHIVQACLDRFEAFTTEDENVVKQPFVNLLILINDWSCALTVQIYQPMKSFSRLWSADKDVNHSPPHFPTFKLQFISLVVLPPMNRLHQTSFVVKSISSMLWCMFNGAVIRGVSLSCGLDFQPGNRDEYLLLTFFDSSFSSPSASKSCLILVRAFWFILSPNIPSGTVQLVHLILQYLNASSHFTCKASKLRRQIRQRHNNSILLQLPVNCCPIF